MDKDFDNLDSGRFGKAKNIVSFRLACVYVSKISLLCMLQKNHHFGGVVSTCFCWERAEKLCHDLWTTLC